MLQNDISRGNFMRKIDCAHFRSVKTFVWPLKIENTYFYLYKNRYFNSCFYYFWAKKSKINFFSIIFFKKIRWLGRSNELSGDRIGFKLDFWRIFEMWEQYTYRLFFGCSKYGLKYMGKNSYFSIFKGQKIFSRFGNARNRFFA